MTCHNLNPQHIEVLQQAAAACHAAVNQTYDGYLPYEFHLRLTASYARRFIHLLHITEEQAETIMAAAFFHDALEDARLTYNDLMHLLNDLKTTHQLLLNVHDATEMVYALTNEKGRNRAERANDKYYEGIRLTPYASYLKMCDRLANVCYSTQFSEQSKMAKIYLNEMPHFLQSIGEIPQEMVDLALYLLKNQVDL